MTVRKPPGSPRTPPLLGRRDGSFVHTDPWRVMRIMSEFVDGFDALAEIPRAVAVFGSARVRRSERQYAAARAVGRHLAEAGFAVITGGGPGLMEAANRGCKEGGGALGGVQHRAAVRAGDERVRRPRRGLPVLLRSQDDVREVLGGLRRVPGGFGTLDELFEALTLIQTGKVLHFPVVLYGTEYREGLLDWIRSRMLAEHKIKPRDLDLFVICDEPEQVVEHFQEALRDSRATWPGPSAPTPSRLQTGRPRPAPSCG